MAIEDLFIVRTERESFLFRMDKERFTTVCYPLTPEALERSQLTVFDLRVPSDAAELAAMKAKESDSGKRYIAMYNREAALKRIGVALK